MRDLANFTINPRTSSEKTIEAEYWKVEDGFVVFYKPGNEGSYSQVLAIKEKLVSTVVMN